jgi:hypothetical protein
MTLAQSLGATSEQIRDAPKRLRAPMARAMLDRIFKLVDQRFSISHSQPTPVKTGCVRHRSMARKLLRIVEE